MKKKIVLSVIIVGIIAVSYSFIKSDKVLNENSTAAVELKTGMRRLWDDHVVWTRNVILNIIDDLPGTDQAVKRLLKNQDDIGRAMKTYYGDAASKELTTLLHTHINTAADLLKALKAGDEIALKDANIKWISNANLIAEFLSKANPSWKLTDMKKMMQDHLRLTTDEAQARKNKNYDADVKAFDMVDAEIMEMSDSLTMGIIKQFPNKFKMGNATVKN
jgi:hypothetical protein